MKDLDQYIQICKETKDILAFEHGGKVFIGDATTAIEQYFCVERDKSFHQWLIDDYKSYVKYTN